MSDKKKEVKTEEEISEEQALVLQAQKLQQKKYDQFVTEYNELCNKYGLQLQPKIGLEVQAQTQATPKK